MTAASPSRSQDPSTGIVVTIDGPAGAGKSTVARLLAERLGFEFLDTGAMYRCVTFAVQRCGISANDEVAVSRIADELKIEMHDDRVILDGEDVSDSIRTPEVAMAIGQIADNVAVRRSLSNLQRRWAQGKHVVTEGRDQGTEVFDDSPCKVFLYATNEERARRRQIELSQRGIEMTFEEVLEQQIQRDADDTSRPVGGLRKAVDAIEFCTDGVTLSSVVDRLEAIVRERICNELQSSNSQNESH